MVDSIAFGDSYSFIQGTAGYPGFTFIGSGLAEEVAFDPDDLLSDEIIQNYTATAEGGPNWLEYLTGCGLENGTSPLTCSMQLWDFAFAAADVSDEFLPRHADFVNPLVNQTQQYLTWAEPVIGKGIDKSKALVAIWIGINDVNDIARLGDDSTDYPALLDDIVTAVFDQSVLPMYDAGYRNFLMVNLPPLDRTSANQKSTDPKPNRTLVGRWNEEIDEQAKLFSSCHSDANVMVYDANIFLNHVMDYPEAYNITVTDQFCAAYNNPNVAENPAKYGCKPLDQYFWFNSGHLYGILP